MKPIALFILFLIFWQQGLAQDVKFTFMFGNEALLLDHEYEYKSKPISFSKFKFYISNVRLLKKNKEVHKSNHYFLVDASETSVIVLEGGTDSIEYDQMKFNIGVDSIKNVSGVFGGALDPTNGMYWAWQSGFINIKIEGYSPMCPSRKNKFQFHLGGYTYPNNSLQEFSVSFIDKKNASYKILLDKFLDSIDLSKKYQVMSPGKTAVKLSNFFTNCIIEDEY